MSTDDTELVEVRFKGNRKAYFTSTLSASIKTGDPVVVELDRGRDLGRVSAIGDLARRKCEVGCGTCDSGTLPDPAGRVLHTASDTDVHVSNELRKAEDDVRKKVRERVLKHELPMKVTDAEWQWDRKKLTIYFTAENRVDFRQLVRDLAGLFRTRIELRQIGARDEAKRLTGVGRCGREYCCSSWLPELRPVSLSLAKDQRLSLNPGQISGGCGRLLCCLRYEHEFYVSSRKRFPKEGKVLTTSVGRERVQAVDIFRERVLLKSEDSTFRTLPLTELRAEVSREPAAPAQPEEPAPVPASLATFDEAAPPLTEDTVSDAVTPARRRRRRRKRRGRGGSGGSDSSKEPSGGE